MGAEHDSHRLLVGIGGTGKSTLLKNWANEVNERSVSWLMGSARRLLSAETLTAALEGSFDIVVLMSCNGLAPMR